MGSLKRILGACMLVGLFSSPTISQSQRTWLPLISWGCPYDVDANGNPRGNYWKYMGQVQQAGFNTIYASGATTADFDTAGRRGMRLIQSMHHPYCEGQRSIYQSEDAGTFNHSSVEGQAVRDDSARNGWAWRALVGIHEVGYIQRDLLDPLNKEQNVVRPGVYDPLTFYADFRMRVPDYPQQSEKGTSAVVRLSVVLKRPSGQGGTVVLATWDVPLSTFQDSGAVGSHYAEFRLPFTVSSDMIEGMDAWNADEGFDYRVYWYGGTDIYLDYVEVRDAVYDSLSRGLYDQQIEQRIQRFSDSNGYYPRVLFRWYLQDEPTTDQYAANHLMVGKLGAHRAPATAPGVQATLGDVRILDDFLEEVQPDSELLFHVYPFTSTTDTCSDGASPPYTRTLQEAFDAVLAEYLTARQKAAEQGLDFWLLPQAHEYIRDNESILRFPTINELKCHVYLCLAAGAKALFYFVYVSDPGYTPGIAREQPAKGQELVDEPHHTLGEGKTMSWTGTGSGGLVWYREKDGEWVKTVTPFGETLWYGVQEVNGVLNSIGHTVAALEWQRTFCADGSGNTGGIVTKVTGDFNPPYVQVAEFLDPQGKPYIELVNRRCLSTEGQTVDVTIDPPDPSVAIYTLTDIYSGETWWIDTEVTHTFTDIALDPGQGRFLVLEPLDVKGGRSLPKQAMHTVDRESRNFSLGPNYPSPFNESTAIPFTLPIGAHVRLSLFDATGREVKVLVDEYCSAGAHVAVLEARNLPSGVYVYRISAGRYRAARKLVLLK